MSQPLSLFIIKKRKQVNKHRAPLAPVDCQLFRSTPSASRISGCKLLEGFFITQAQQKSRDGEEDVRKEEDYLEPIQALFKIEE